MKHHAYIGLGANLHSGLQHSGGNGFSAQQTALSHFQADLSKTLESAIARLTHGHDIVLLQRSDFWRTRPIEALGPDFCNAVIEINTSLSAADLLNQLLAIESEFGRVRSVRNAPRTLDLDLIAINGIQVHEPNLIVPHPRAHERAFVLVPLCQINPSVLLGPQHAQPPSQHLSGKQQDQRSSQIQTLKPASHWLAQLTAGQLGDVAPW